MSKILRTISTCYIHHHSVVIDFSFFVSFLLLQSLSLLYLWFNLVSYHLFFIEQPTNELLGAPSGESVPCICPICCHVHKYDCCSEYQYLVQLFISILGLHHHYNGANPVGMFQVSVEPIRYLLVD